MSVFTVAFVFVAFCYICGSTKAINKDDDFMQVINLANSHNINPKPYTPIQEQQKQQQYEQQKRAQQQQPKKRSTTMTLSTRQKRSQHDLGTMSVYTRKIPTTYAYNLALLNIMQTLRKQLSDMELARLSSRLTQSTAADLQLLNEIYNNKNKAVIFNDENTPLNDDEVDNVNNNYGTRFNTDTDTGNGGFGKFDGIEGVGVEGATVIANNDMLANDIENPTKPWQFVARISKKSSALYKPRLGKRIQQQ